MPRCASMGFQWHLDGMPILTMIGAALLTLVFWATCGRRLAQEETGAPAILEGDDWPATLVRVGWQSTLVQVRVERPVHKRLHANRTGTQAPAQPRV